MSDLINIKIYKNILMSTPRELEDTFIDFEPVTKKIITDNLKFGDNFIDVGANFGYFSLIAAHCVGSEGRVLAFEPSMQTFKILEHNTKNLKNIKLYNVALGSKKESKQFFHANDYVNSGFTKSPFQSDNEYSDQQLSVDTIDNILDSKQEKIDFIKCDVQGDDIEVLTGAKKTIARNKSLKLIVEWAPTWMKSAGYDILDLPKSLCSLGFKKLTVVDDWNKKISSVDEFIDEFKNEKSGKRFCNLFCEK